MGTGTPKICVPLAVTSASEFSPAIDRAARVADLVELRLDYLGAHELALLVRNLSNLIKSSPVPLILTLRPVDEGGRSNLDLPRRVAFWSKTLKHVDCYFDLELTTTEALAAEQNEFDWTRVICSHHDFASSTANLMEIYRRMEATSSGILKLAVMANDAIDCLPVFDLLEAGETRKRKTIAIAMGDAGIMTRILGPSRGSFLTYAPVDDDNATAPGQVSAGQLRDCYQLDRIDEGTEILGLVGRPVSHSISPQIHNALIREANVNAVYIPFDVGDVESFLVRMVHPRSRELHWNVRGLSVTAPHKISVIRHLDWIHDSAKGVGAVNTIVLKGSQLRGYNTDTEGFVLSLRERFSALKKMRCAIIGAGGAARAALWALKNEGADATLFCRDRSKGKVVANLFDAPIETLSGANFEGFDIVVNATPAGTRGEREHESPAKAEQLRNVRLVYDLVYNPVETSLLREAKSAGCETLGGLEMLLAQAAVQFSLWTGKRANRDAARDAAVQALTRMHHISAV
jgi:3-dehydroquinate dehydratase/shikimate dehydrogenase